MHAAVENSDEPIIRYLIQKADINSKDNDNMTPLELAAQLAHFRELKEKHKWLNIIKLLLDSGADLEGFDHFIDPNDKNKNLDKISSYDKDIATYYKEHLREATSNRSVQAKEEYKI